MNMPDEQMMEAPQEAMGAAPEMPQQPEMGGGDDNPVFDAIQALAVYIAAQTEKGNPQGAAMQDWLRQGLELLGQGGEQGGAMPEAPAQPPAPEEEKEYSRDMNAGANSVRVM